MLFNYALKIIKMSYFVNAVSKFKYSSVGYNKYNLLKPTHYLFL